MNFKSIKVLYIKALFVAISALAVFGLYSSNQNHLKLPNNVQAQGGACNPGETDMGVNGGIRLCCPTGGGSCRQVAAGGALSANLQPASGAEVAAVKAALQSTNNSCPEPIKQRYLQLIDEGAQLYLQGTLVVAQDANGAPIALTCANASALQKIVIRGIMILFTLIGLVLVVAITRASILMITSFQEPEQFETGVKSLVTSIAYTFGVLFFYTLFIFVAVDVIGIGKNTTRPEFNLFCSNRIVINITFDQNQGC